MDGKRLAKVVGKLWPGVHLVVGSGTPTLQGASAGKDFLHPAALAPPRHHHAGSRLAAPEDLLGPLSIYSGAKGASTLPKSIRSPNTRRADMIFCSA